MQVDLNKLINNNDVVAVATSGGSDSMALLHYLHKNSDTLQIKVLALNVEHGIRGQSSIDDSIFVKDYCKANDIPCLSYTVDSLKKAKDDGLSVEQAARTLRYACFFDAIEKGKCTKIATAHHLKDNLESVLFNLFRGSGLKGLSGIKQNVLNKIIRPFLSVEKQQINEYVSKNNIPFVIDKTNFDDNFTRNHIRLNVLPQIEKVFPEVQKSVLRFCEITRQEDEYLDEQARLSLTLSNDFAQLKLPLHNALFSRAVIIALQHLGVKKDWEKVHVDSVIALSKNQNGASINLLDGVVAIKEYDKITFYRKSDVLDLSIPFNIGKITVGERTFRFEKTKNPNLKDGFYFDLDKIPLNTTVRFKQDGDRFTKFGGGTKDLNDYLCDKKIPLRLRNSLPLLAHGNKILFVFGVAISNDIKVDETTKNIIKFTEE